MDHKNEKRNRIKIGILCAVVAVFIITGIVYAYTLHTYIVPDPQDMAQDETVSTETIQSPAEIQPEKEQTIPETETKDRIPSEEPGFQETCSERYAKELTETELWHLSDTAYVAVFQREWNGHPYTMAHVVMASPDQMITVVSGEKRLAVRVCEEENAVLSMSASMMRDQNSFIDGVHITDSRIISNGQTVMGTELACSLSGELSLLTPDTDMNDIRFTVLATTPLLIEDGKPAEIPETNRSSTNCKSAIGSVSPCEYYFLTASDGDYINDLTYTDIQDILLENGCTFAKSLTTDINVSMAFNGQLVNQPAEQSGRTQYEYIIIKD